MNLNNNKVIIKVMIMNNKVKTSKMKRIYLNVIFVGWMTQNL